MKYILNFTPNINIKIHTFVYLSIKLSSYLLFNYIKLIFLENKQKKKMCCRVFQILITSKY